MSATRQDIASRYEVLGDAELQEMLRSGELTELAQEVAAAELARRGIAPPPSSEPAGASPVPLAPKPRRRNTRPLWWAYFGFLCLWFVFGMVRVALSDATRLASGPSDLLFGVSAAIDLVCIVGLFGYVAKRRLVAAGFWCAMLILYLLKIGFGSNVLLANLLRISYAAQLYPWRLDREFFVALAGLGGVLIVAPMIVALWNYTFRSPELWRRRPV